MNLPEKIERVFSSRPKPAQVRLADDVLKHDPDMKFLRDDPDVKDAIWFSGRDRHELTWQNWQEHASALSFFDAGGFVYYLPSVLLLALQNPSDWLSAADSLIGQLDRTPDPEGSHDVFDSRFLELNRAELEVLKEWLLQVSEYAPYKSWGIAASGPGDSFGRAFDYVDLLQKEVERRRT